MSGIIKSDTEPVKVAKSWLESAAVHVVERTQSGMESYFLHLISDQSFEM